MHQVAKLLSFSFSISPCNEYSGLISFRIDWLDLFSVQGTLKCLLQHHKSKASILQHSAFFMVQFSHPYMTTGKTIDLVFGAFITHTYCYSHAGSTHCMNVSPSFLWIFLHFHSWAQCVFSSIMKGTHFSSGYILHQGWVLVCPHGFQLLIVLPILYPSSFFIACPQVATSDRRHQ